MRLHCLNDFNNRKVHKREKEIYSLCKFTYLGPGISKICSTFGFTMISEPERDPLGHPSSFYEYSLKIGYKTVYTNINFFKNKNEYQLRNLR